MIELNNGIQMPTMAIGTNWMNYSELKKIVRAGLLAGFRGIDTARDYGNEPVVGRVLRDVLPEVGLQRKDIFITTKIGNSQQIQGNIKQELAISLNNLQVDYIDMWIMHWPYPDFFTDTWLKMTGIYEAGGVKAIGVANFHIRHLKELLSEQVKIIPMVNQIEYHPLRTVTDLVCFMSENNIKLQAYAPLCRMVPFLKNSLLLSSLSKKYNKSIGQIILRWHVQQGFIMPIFKTNNHERFLENIQIFDFELARAEMSAIFNMNTDYKYHIESVNCPGY
jgi:diketogulonate reductase-like aldo/keto reductase